MIISIVKWTNEGYLVMVLNLFLDYDKQKITILEFYLD